MPYCTSCGAQIASDANFCTSCGRPRRQAQAEPKLVSKSDRRAEFLQSLRTMEAKEFCAYCIHRSPDNICGAVEGPKYRQTIQHLDQCGAFVNSPARQNYIRGVYLDENAASIVDPREIAAEFREAVRKGLPTEDELKARFYVGKWLSLWTRSLKVDVRERAAMAETKEALAELEAAVALDRTGGFGFFEKPENRVWLNHLDLLYALYGGLLSIEKGKDGKASDAASVEYWEQKLPLCAYLSSSPLLCTLQEAGYAYSRLGKKNQDIACFSSLLKAAPVNPADELGREAKLRENARVCVESLHKGVT